MDFFDKIFTNEFVEKDFSNIHILTKEESEKAKEIQNNKYKRLNKKIRDNMAKLNLESFRVTW